MTRKFISMIVLLLLAAAPLVAEQAIEQDDAGQGRGAGIGSGSGSGEKGEKEARAYGGPSYLGVDIDDISPDRAKELKIGNDTGVEITMVDRDAPAGKAGLKEHDVILKFNTTDVESVEQLRRLIQETPAGRTVTLTVSRDGQSMPVQVTLAPRKEYYGHNIVVPPVPPVPPVEMPNFEMHLDIPEVVIHQSSSKTGLTLENLSPQLREYFGVKSNEGVLVRSVTKGTPGDTAGFRAGDVIVRVDKDRISDVGDWRSTIGNRTGNVPVGVVRDKKEQTLTINLPVRKGSLEMPEIKLDTEEMSREMAQLGPEFQKQMAELQKTFENPQFQKQMQALHTQFSNPQFQKQLQDEMKKMQEDLQKSMQEFQKEMDQYRYEWQAPEAQD